MGCCEEDDDDSGRAMCTVQPLPRVHVDELPYERFIQVMSHGQLCAMYVSGAGGRSLHCQASPLFSKVLQLALTSAPAVPVYVFSCRAAAARTSHFTPALTSIHAHRLCTDALRPLHCLYRLSAFWHRVH